MPVGSPPSNPEVPIDVLRSTLAAYPIRLAILFGSHATGTSHQTSDIDVAVEFDGLEPGDEDFNEVFFGLSADLSEIVGTDDIDLVDVHMLPSTLIRTVFDDGILLIGTETYAETRREQLLAAADPEQSPQERLDEAIRKIDEYFA
jgi:predicted nucleotidyltransferase